MEALLLGRAGFEIGLARLVSLAWFVLGLRDVRDQRFRGGCWASRLVVSFQRFVPGYPFYKLKELCVAGLPGNHRGRLPHARRSARCQRDRCLAYRPCNSTTVRCRGPTGWDAGIACVSDRLRRLWQGAKRLPAACSFCQGNAHNPGDAASADWDALASRPRRATVGSARWRASWVSGPLHLAVAALAALAFAAPVHAQTPTIPEIDSLTIDSSPTSGLYYSTGDTVTVTVAFNEAVTVDTAMGTPSLDLEVGGWSRAAEYTTTTSSDARTLSFAYIVAGGDYDGDGIAVAAASVALNGGTILGQGTSLVASLAHAGLPDQDGHRVNKDPATTSSGILEDSSPVAASNTYGAGETIVFKVIFDTAVVVDARNGRPRLLFKLGDGGNVREEYLVYLRGSGTATLYFAYVVQSTDADDNGIRIGKDALELNGGQISHATTGRDAELTHGKPGDNASFPDVEIDGSLAPLLASLTALSLSEGTLSPAFAAETTSYTASVANAVTETTVAATPETGASATVLQADADGLTVGHQVALEVGDSELLVKVEKSGSAPQIYTIIVTRTPTVEIGTETGTQSIEYDLSTGYADFMYRDGEVVIDDFYSSVKLEGVADEIENVDYASRTVETTGNVTKIINTDSRYPTMTQVFVTDSGKNIKTYLLIEDAVNTLSTNRMVPIQLKAGAVASLGEGKFQQTVAHAVFSAEWNHVEFHG